MGGPGLDLVADQLAGAVDLTGQPSQLPAVELPQMIHRIISTGRDTRQRRRIDPLQRRGHRAGGTLRVLLHLTTRTPGFRGALRSTLPFLRGFTGGTAMSENPEVSMLLKAPST